MIQCVWRKSNTPNVQQVSFSTIRHMPNNAYYNLEHPKHSESEAINMRLNRGEIGERIRSEILKSGKSQNQIAEAAGIGKDTLSCMVNGSQAKLESIIAVADVLGVSLDYLTGRDECKSHDAQSIHEYTGLSDSSISWLHETIEKANDPRIIFAGKSDDEKEKLMEERMPEYLEAIDFFSQAERWRIDFIDMLIADQELLSLMDDFFHRLGFYSTIAQIGTNDIRTRNGQEVFDSLMETMLHGFANEIGEKSLKILLRLYRQRYFDENEEDSGIYFDKEKLDEYLLKEYKQRHADDETED